MTDRELDIIRYIDGTLTESDRAGFEAERVSDDRLASEVTTEETIQRSLRADADRLERDFATVPGAPLLTQLATSAESSADNKVIYYVLGAVALIILWLLYSLVRSNPSDTPASIPSTVPSKVQPALDQPTPDHPVPSSVPSPVVTKPSVNQMSKTPVTTPKPESIDLDKGLEKPRVFTDSVGHMSLEKK